MDAIVVVICVVCAVMGVGLGFFAGKARMSKQVETAKAEASATNESLRGTVANLQADLRIAENNVAAVKQRATEEMAASAERERQTKAEADRLLAQTKAEDARRLEEAKNESAKRLQQAKDEAQQHENAAKQEREEDFARQLESMKAQFQTISEKLLKERSEALGGANREQMEKLMGPLLQELGNMRKQMGDTKEGNDKNSAALGEALKNMMEQSTKLSKDAQNLTDALKNRGKVQGDWGEQVLANILMDSGLREGEEFFTQKNYTGANNQNFRPDVVVKAADGTMIIVDSKVSLTAYNKYVSAEDDATREEASKENLESVQKHVDELAGKDYPKLVPNALPYVLMFVPNEGSYILAMNRDPQVGIKAYKKGVLIINPTNLMLALSLILFTWKNTRQEENCANILKAAEDLYEKFCGFTETFVKLGKQLDTARGTYDTAVGQLKDGRGSIVSKFEGMQELGLTSTKTVNEKLLS